MYVKLSILLIVDIGKSLPIIIFLNFFIFGWLNICNASFEFFAIRLYEDAVNIKSNLLFCFKYISLKIIDVFTILICLL